MKLTVLSCTILSRSDKNIYCN